MKLFFNGRYYEEDRALLKALDRGFLFGDGVFTTIKAEKGFPWFLNQHLKRLQSSCSFLGIAFPPLNFEEIISQLLKRNQLHNARIKIILTRGWDFKNQLVNYEGGASNVVVLAFPLSLAPVRPATLYISPETRGNESIYKHKTISYLQNLIHKTEAQRRGFDDAIILNGEKKILETATANLFFFIRDKIVTPPAELPLLNGIIRQNLLSLGKIKSYPIIEDFLTLQELKKVEGVFITSAIFELRPVSRIENLKFSIVRPQSVRKEWIKIKNLFLRPELVRRS